MQLILDIENTIIESLDVPRFLDDNCKKIKAFIKRYDPMYVHLFTWGWKTHDDIDRGIYQMIIDVLEIYSKNLGLVYTKSDSVDYAISRGWLKESDRSEVLIPGMMKAYGLGKIHLVTEQFANNDLSKYAGHNYVIIDDLVNDEEHNTRPYHNILLLNPEKDFGGIQINK